MLLSLGLILLLGFLSGKLFTKIKLPPLVGMIIVGILIGPHLLNIVDKKLIDISEDLRKIALIIILIRAGLSLKLDDLIKVGKPSLLLCFVPAIIEILGMAIFAPIIFNLSVLDSILLGTIIAAVSPAVIVPQMLKVIDEGYGVKQGVPQMILAGASADDVFVIALFTSVLGLKLTGKVDFMSILNIPISLISGVIIGILIGIFINAIINKFNINLIQKVLLLFAVSILLSESEYYIKNYFGFSSLLSIMTMGMTIMHSSPKQSIELSKKFSEAWEFSQIILFVLLGMSVDINSLEKAGLSSILLIVLVLLFRMIGVLLSVSTGKLNKSEKIFSMFSYIPKATVQAAIGGIPLAMGISSGSLILTVSVVSILLTAPIGAILIDKSYKKLLSK